MVRHDDGGVLLSGVLYKLKSSIQESADRRRKAGCSMAENTVEKYA